MYFCYDKAFIPFEQDTVLFLPVVTNYARNFRTYHFTNQVNTIKRDTIDFVGGIIN
ncbi:protein of unknown function [Tenacibaculum aestuariivivum]